MFWGTRKLVLASLGLLHLGAISWAAPEGDGHHAAPTPLSSDKQKRDSDTVSEILIEHIDDDKQGIIPLLFGLLLLGASVLVALLLLGCVLLIRVLEARESRYQRLQSEDQDVAYCHTKTDMKPSQTFTFVDLSNAECACQERTIGTVVQPRFAVQFQTVSRVDASQTDAAKVRESAPTAALRKEKPGAGLPEADPGELSPEPFPPMAAAEQKESRESTFSTASQQPPKKRFRKDSTEGPHMTGARMYPDDHSFWERNAVIRSYSPAFEVGLHDRRSKFKCESAWHEGAREGKFKAYFSSHGEEMAADMSANREIPLPLGGWEAFSYSSPEDLTGTTFSPSPATSNEASMLFTPTQASEHGQRQVFEEAMRGPSVKLPAAVAPTTGVFDVTSSDTLISNLRDEGGHDPYYGNSQPDDEQETWVSHLRHQSGRKDVPSESGISASTLPGPEGGHVNTSDGQVKPVAAMSNLAGARDSGSRARSSAKSAPSHRRHSEAPKKTPGIPLEQETARRPRSADTRSPGLKVLSFPVPQMISFFDRGHPSKQGLDKGELIKGDTTGALRETSPEERRRLTTSDKEELIKRETTGPLREASPEERRRLTTSDRALVVSPVQIITGGFDTEKPELQVDTSSHRHSKSPEERRSTEKIEDAIDHDVSLKRAATNEERELSRTDAQEFSEERGPIERTEETFVAGQSLKKYLEEETRNPSKDDVEPQLRPTDSKEKRRPENTIGATDVQQAFGNSQRPKERDILEIRTPRQIPEKPPDQRRGSDRTQQALEVQQKAPSGSLVSRDEAGSMTLPLSRTLTAAPEISPVSPQLKPPPPPLQPTRPEPNASRPRQDPSSMTGSGLSSKPRHDVHGSTEPFSVDERPESISCTSSELETSTDYGDTDKEPLASTALPPPPSAGVLRGPPAAAPRSKSSPRTRTPELVVEPSADTQLKEPESSHLVARDASPDENIVPAKEPLIKAEHRSLLFPPPPEESELRDLSTQMKQPSSLETLKSSDTGEAMKAKTRSPEIIAFSMQDADPGVTKKEVLQSPSTFESSEHVSPTTVVMPFGRPSSPYGAVPRSPFPENPTPTPQESSALQLSPDKPVRLQDEYVTRTEPELKLQAPEKEGQLGPAHSQSPIKRIPKPESEHLEKAPVKMPTNGSNEPSPEWKKEWLSLRDRLMRAPRDTGAADIQSKGRRMSAPLSSTGEASPLQQRKGDKEPPQPVPSQYQRDLSTPVLEKKNQMQLKPEGHVPLQSKSPGYRVPLERSIIPKGADGGLVLKPVLGMKTRDAFKTKSPNAPPVTQPTDVVYGPKPEATVDPTKPPYVVESALPAFQALPYSPTTTLGPAKERDYDSSLQAAGTRQEQATKFTTLVAEFPSSQLTTLVTELPESQIEPSTVSGVHRIGLPSVYFSAPREPLYDPSVTPPEARALTPSARADSLMGGFSAWSAYEKSPPTGPSSRTPTTKDPARTPDPTRTSDLIVSAQSSQDLIRFPAVSATEAGRPDSEAEQRSRPVSPEPSPKSPKKKPNTESPK